MDFEVGDKVVRKSTLELGSVQSTRRAKALMVEVKWDATGVKQWLPAEEFQPWDKSELPPPPYVSPWGRTTPGYIIGIRSSAQVRDERKNRLSQPSKKSLETIADSLSS